MYVGDSAQPTDSTKKVRIIPFAFAETPTQSYILEFSALKMRVYWGGDRVPVLDSSVASNTVVFKGSGQNDMYTNGGSFAYTGTFAYTYKVKIDGTGTPDTYSWYKNNVLKASEQSCSDSEVELEDGVYIVFGETTGHTVDDYWVITFDSDRYELATVYDEASIPLLRYAQSGDRLYLVDGTNEPQVLTRSGHNSWAIETISISGEPFSTKNNSRYSFYRYHDVYLGKHAAGHVIDGQNSLEKFYDISSGESGGPEYLATGKYTNDDAEGISTERGISFMYTGYGDSYPDGPDALVDALASSFTGDYLYNIFLKMDGTIKIPYAGDWYFALNASRYADFAFQNEDNFLLQLYGYRHLLVLPGYRVQYENFTDEKGTNQKRISTKQTNLGAHEYSYWGRMMAHNTVGWGYDLAWRLGGDIVLGGDPDVAPSGKLSLYQLREYNTYVKHVSNDNENWYGNRCLEVQIFMDSDTTWGWKYKEITSFDSSGPVYSGEYVTINTEYGVFTNYQLNDPIGGASGPFEGDGQIADIDWDDSDPEVMGLADGMTWTFRVGFLPIPGSAFINTDLTEETTYPKVVTISDNRLWFFNSSGRPSAAWASKVDQFTNFVEDAVTLKDDDALSFTLSSNQIDPIRWAKPGRQMIIGTASMEYTIKWPNGFPSPLEVPEVKPNTYYGSKFVDPAQAANIIVFAEKSGLRLRSYGYRFDIDGYSGTDDSVLAYEEISAGIKELAYQQAGDIGYISSQDGVYAEFSGLVLPITNALWIITDTGKLKGITLEPEHKVLAWHEHTDDATVPAVFESVATIPGATGDEVWVVAFRGGNRYIEVLDNTAPMDGWDRNLDAGNQPSDASDFTGTVETIPFEIIEGKDSTIAHKKRWVYVDADVLAAQNLGVARGTVDYDAKKQIFSTMTSPGVARKILFGWDKIATLVLKAPGTSGIAYPTIVRAIQGRIQINE